MRKSQFLHSPADPLKCKTQKKNFEKKPEQDELSADLSDISEDCFTDILSSDSDDSSIEEIKYGLMSLNKTLKPEEVEEEEPPAEDDSLERMLFYSMYIDDDFKPKEEPDIEPQRSDGYDNYRPYTGLESYLKDQEAKQYIWGGLKHEEFENLLNAGLKDELLLEDIDGNVSIKTLAENNFKTLGMDGPTRKIALLFDYKPEDGFHLSNEFRDFMNSQKEISKEISTYIGGVLLLYEEIGIHVVEGSEYVLLRHFPNFLKSELFMKLINCKVLGIEELSAMKSFKQYACYKGFPPKPKQKIPEKITTYAESIKFLKQLGKRLNNFWKFAYTDQASRFEDNKIPEDVTLNMPPKEYLYFALRGDWTPGLRSAKDWFEKAKIFGTESDDSEFVFPPRSDHLPVYTLHTTPEEDENVRKSIAEELKSVKLPSTKPPGYREEKIEKVQKRDEFGNPIHPFKEALENLLDPEYEWPEKLKTRPAYCSEGEKGYDSQSSVVDPQEIDTDLEDYLDHIESVKM